MNRKSVPRLLASELEILEMLWRCGPVTILQAQQSLDQAQGYSTVQTRLNRLAKKGVIKRSQERPSRYSAAIQPDDVVSGDLNTLVEKVSGGRVIPLMACLMRDRDLTADEVAELKQLIAVAEKQGKSKSKPRGKKK